VNCTIKPYFAIKFPAVAHHNQATNTTNRQYEYTTASLFPFSVILPYIFLNLWATTYRMYRTMRTMVLPQQRCFQIKQLQLVKCSACHFMAAQEHFTNRGSKPILVCSVIIQTATMSKTMPFAKWQRLVGVIQMHVLFQWFTVRILPHVFFWGTVSRKLL
jgi:hypothetical protein